MCKDAPKTVYGRMARHSYWRIFIVINIAVFFISYFLASISPVKFELGGRIAIGLLFTVVLAVLSAERCHDRDKSGYFAILLFVPVVCLWPLVELLFLRGTVGPNKYGPDPLRDENEIENQDKASLSGNTSDAKIDKYNESTDNLDMQLIHDLKELCRKVEGGAVELIERGYKVEVVVHCTQNGITISPRISKEF